MTHPNAALAPQSNTLREGLAARIQNTLVGQAITADQVAAHVASAVEYGFDAITVPGSWVAHAKGLLARAQQAAARATAPGSLPPHTIRLGSILDFPYGSASTAARVSAAAAMAVSGAEEIDSTVNIGFMLSGRRSDFVADLRAIVTGAGPVPVKFMLELPLLDESARDFVVDAAVEAGAAYVKNASRGAVGIADVAAISYLRRRVPESVGVKASGGIRTAQQVRELVAAGADLVGTSAGVAIVTGSRAIGDSLERY